MKYEEIIDGIASVLKEILSLKEVAITDSTTSKDFTNWDSLAHIDIILAVEEKFGVRITATKASKLQNVGELVQLIRDQKGWQ